MTHSRFRFVRRLDLRMTASLAACLLGWGVAHAAPSAPVAVDSVVSDIFLKASNAESLDQFGDAVAMSGDTLVIGASVETSGASGVNGDQTDNGLIGVGAAYVFVKSPQGWTQQAYLKPSNPSACSSFGSAVDIDGDTIVIGAFREFSGASGVDGVDSGVPVHGSGAAYVFARTGDTWAQQAHLKSPSPDEWDQFGISVAVSGDLVAVGASWESGGDGGVNGDPTSNAVGKSGAVFTFVRSGTTWSQDAYLKAPTPHIIDYFGESVDISGDSLVVGAWGEFGTPPELPNNSDGTAYVFTRAGGTWTQQAALGMAIPGNAEFGRSVAIDGDTILVGSPEEAAATLTPGGPGAEQSGAVHVFVRSGTTWSREALLKADDYSEFDEFGWSVDLEGNRAVVGADRERNSFGGVNPTMVNDTTNNAGAAFVFERDGADWRQLAYLKADAPEVKDYYGDDVAIAGNAVIVGAFADDSPAIGIGGDPVPGGAAQSGAAYAYEIVLPATTFCFGDGTGVACPCSNEGSAGEGCANSTGQGAVLTATGTSSVANDDLVFHVTGGRPNHPGMLVQGGSQIAVPFKDGILCAGVPNERMEVAILDSAGSGSTVTSIVTGGNVSPGQVRYYQFWYRDTGLSVCMTGSNFTQGLRVEWL